MRLGTVQSTPEPMAVSTGSSHYDNVTAADAVVRPPSPAVETSLLQVVLCLHLLYDAGPVRAPGL